MFLSQFDSLCAWEDRMETLGHGERSPMSAEEALDIARSTPIATAEDSDPQDPQGLEPGMSVSVAPDVDGGEQAVEGVLQSASIDKVAVRRDDPRAGTVCVHNYS